MKKIKRNPEMVKLAKEMILNYEEIGDTVIMDKAEMEKVFRWLKKNGVSVEIKRTANPAK